MVLAEFYVVKTPGIAPEVTPEFLALEDNWRQKIEKIDETGRIKLFDGGECLTPESDKALELSLDVMKGYGVKETKSEPRGCRRGCSYEFTLFETGADLSFVQVTGRTCARQERVQLWAVRNSGLFTPLVRDLYNSFL